MAIINAGVVGFDRYRGQWRTSNSSPQKYFPPKEYSPGG